MDEAPIYKAPEKGNVEELARPKLLLRRYIPDILSVFIAGFALWLFYICVMKGVQTISRYAGVGQNLAPWGGKVLPRQPSSPQENIRSGTPSETATSSYSPTFGPGIASVFDSFRSHKKSVAELNRSGQTPKADDMPNSNHPQEGLERF